MLPWFLREPERLKRERTGIENLSRSADWLIGAEWLLDGDLCLDSVIQAHGYNYTIRVTFPSLYPEVPLVVRPRNMESRVSGHQYGGADGPLCLEWGPDNWHQDVTAVQMLESAHKLFEIENPIGQKERPEMPVVAPSRHHLTIGQELRGEMFRWYASEGFQGFLVGQAKNAVGSFRFSLRILGDRWLVLVHEATPIDGEKWKDPTIPEDLPDAGPLNLNTGIWFKTNLDPNEIGKPERLADLQYLLQDQNATQLLATDGTSPISGFQGSLTGALISDRLGKLHLFTIHSGKTVIGFSQVSSEQTCTHSRSPDSVHLGNKSVGIFGLGSAGSKLAISLARMGVRQFYLVDHDVLLPENLQRHALDWQSVAEHKADAVATALRHIATNVHVDVSRVHLMGQESSAANNGALDRLSGCDLLVDATADSRVFNLLAAVAKTATKPMVWLEIFAGGIGGLVARSRPGQDRCPQDMRLAYLQYCSEHPDPSFHVVSENYTVEMPDGKALTASDADVALIAHHAARFVADCFTSPDQSKFPYSMYLIGMQTAWVFEAPFATIPISTEALPLVQPQPSDDEISAENMVFLSELLKK